MAMNKRVRGIEPPCAAWEAAVLPLNYTREQIFDCRFMTCRLQPKQIGNAIRLLTSNHCNPKAFGAALSAFPFRWQARRSVRAAV
jgi:hypothetical protein